MNTKDAARKIVMGQTYQTVDGREFMNVGGDFWAQCDEAGRVFTSSSGRTRSYDSRWLAQAAAKYERGTEGEVQWPRR